MSAVQTVLSTRGLGKKFGGITATDNVSLDLKKGARHALIGPNGAGKTTLINLLTGVLEPSEGSITLEGQDISRLAPHERVKRGMVRTFQINQLFDSLTPLETLALTVSQNKGLGGKWWQPLGQDKASGLGERPKNQRIGLRQTPPARNRHRPGLRASCIAARRASGRCACGRA
jgi:branched-chain amino acid transport system ATP-binding protein